MRKQYLGLFSVTYMCQKCHVHFVVVYPDEEQVKKKLRCPFSECGDAKAIAVDWDEDLDYLFEKGNSTKEKKEVQPSREKVKL